MGILACLEPQYRLSIPDTPPELVSPSSSSYSSRPSEGHRSWAPVAPPSPPMSNYDQQSSTDMSSGKLSDETQDRRDATQTASRQQLPSLSSLFGPSAGRPLHSPLSEHPGPYTSTSPLDHPRSAAPHGERSVSSSSYFPSAASSSQPRSVYEPKFEERPSFQPLSRTPFPGPLSPRSRDSDRARPDSRSDYGSSSKWSIRQEVGRNEYSFGGREPQLYKSPHDTLPPQLAGQKHDHDGRIGYRDHQTAHSSGHLPPPTSSSSSINSEAIPTKDGLGPKIWTGTHFLPRFVRAAEVPGEGMCYFYDDGSHCKTVIDGEQVNAHWGVTKAGKPRKRLAIACVTCREKKIKCDPDYPRCVQCEKFGRVCKFKNAPRGGHNTSPSTPPAEREESPHSSGPSRPPFELPRPSSHSSASVSPRTTLRAPSPELSMVPPKRVRIGYESYPPPMAGQRSPMGPISDAAKPALSWHQPELPRIHEDVLCRAWQTDPYVSDPQSVTSTIAHFFAHLDSTALRFLPEKAFKAWLVQSSAAHSRKSPEDMMLVYSILALGVALSRGPKNIASEYAQVARYATEHTAGLCLQLVQARIVLSLYYLSISRLSDANDMSSAAISAATCLQLNLEMDQSPDADLTEFPYGLSRHGYAECRRRTFWSCFILERTNGMFPSRISIINSDDVFLRLPADIGSFEEQMDVDTPVFEPHFSSTEHQQRGVGAMGYLVRIVDLWGDVMTMLYRTAHRTSITDSDILDFHRRLIQRLEDWRLSLPEGLRFSVSPDSIDRETRGSFVSMHLVYFMTMIRLHRYAPPKSAVSASRLDTVRNEAKAMLSMVSTFESSLIQAQPGIPPPFTAGAIVEIVDILSAAGPVSELPALVRDLNSARAVLDMLSGVWEDSSVHKIVVDRRINKLHALQERPEADSPISGARLFLYGRNRNGESITPVAWWQISDPLETRFPKDMDAVYQPLTATPLDN